MNYRPGKGMLRRAADKATALAALLLLAACATEPVDDFAGRPIEFPHGSETIDLAETDLNLSLTSPFQISSVQERVSEDQVFENIYTFHRVKGFVRTSRVVFGHFSRETSSNLRTGRVFHDYASELSIPPGDALQVGTAHRFENGDPHTLGFYTLATMEPYYSSCFVARIGYLLVDYAIVEREPDSVDTIVEVFLCGKLPPQEVLLDFLAQVKPVDDRAAYRRELSKRAIGTI